MLNSKKDDLDVPYVLLMGFCFALIIFCVFGIFLSIKENTAHENYLTKNECVLKSETETGRTVYCGKACYRKEVTKVYICKSGELVETK